MTTVAYRTPQKTAALGFEALVEKLGLGGAVEFVYQYESGKGNYTRERKQTLSGFRLENLRRKLIKKRPRKS